MRYEGRGAFLIQTEAKSEEEAKEKRLFNFEGGLSNKTYFDIQ